MSFVQCIYRSHLSKLQFWPQNRTSFFQSRTSMTPHRLQNTFLSTFETLRNLAPANPFISIFSAPHSCPLIFLPLHLCSDRASSHCAIPFLCFIMCCLILTFFFSVLEFELGTLSHATRATQLLIVTSDVTCTSLKHFVISSGPSLGSMPF
jgi:hypothetical protein